MCIGLDVQKEIAHYAMVDGTVVKRGRFRTTSEGLDEFADILPENAKVAIEASTSVELRQSRRAALGNYLEVLRVLGERINEVESILREKAEITEEASWLMRAQSEKSVIF